MSDSSERQITTVRGTWEFRDTQGTVRNCPEFCGGLISQVHFYVLNDLGTEVAVLRSQVVPISQVVLKTGCTHTLLR